MSLYIASYNEKNTFSCITQISSRIKRNIIMITKHEHHVIMKNNINHLKYVTDFSDMGNNL